MKNKTINYIELMKRVKHIEELKRNGFVIIPKRNFKVLGGCLIGLGLVTWFIPFTTIPLLVAGFLLIGLSKQELMEKIRKKFKLMIYKLRVKLK